jgi:hypothetical protein
MILKLMASHPESGAADTEQVKLEPQPETKVKWCVRVPKFPYEKGVTDVIITCKDGARLGFNECTLNAKGPRAWKIASHGTGVLAFDYDSTIVCTGLAWLSCDTGIQPIKWLRAVVIHDWGVDRQEWFQSLVKFSASFDFRSLELALYSLMMYSRDLPVKLSESFMGTLRDNACSPAYKTAFRYSIGFPEDVSGRRLVEREISNICAAAGFFDESLNAPEDLLKKIVSDGINSRMLEVLSNYKEALKDETYLAILWCVGDVSLIDKLRKAGCDLHADRLAEFKNGI